MKTIIKIGLIILAVMFIMKMMKGKRCEGFTQKQQNKVICNCNINNQENFASDWKEKQKIEDDEAKKHLEKLKKDSSIDTIDKYLSKIPDAPYTPVEGIPKPKYARTFCNFIIKNRNYFIDLHKNMPKVFNDLKNKIGKLTNIADVEILKTFSSKAIEDKSNEYNDFLDIKKNPTVDYNKAIEMKKEIEKLSSTDLKEYIFVNNLCENIGTEVPTTPVPATQVQTTPVPTTPVPTQPVPTTIPIQASTCNHQQCFTHLDGIDIDWPNNLNDFSNLMKDESNSGELGVCSDCLSDQDLETIFNLI